MLLTVAGAFQEHQGNVRSQDSRCDGCL